MPLDLSALAAGAAPGQGDDEGTFARRTEAVELALLRRLSLLDEVARELWSARFGPVAELRLSEAGRDRGRLARVERDHPATAGAAAAAVRLFEQSLEEGRPLVARSWLERAATHAALARAAPWAAAVALRSEALAALAPAPGPDEDPGREPSGWRSAAALELVGVTPLSAGPGTSPPAAGAPGLAFLDDGRVLVQAARFTWVVRPGVGARGFEPWKLAAQAGLRPTAPVSEPGEVWRFAPASDGRDVWLVEGRAGADPLELGEPADDLAGALGLERELRSNALLCLRPPDDVGLAELRWGIGDGGWIGPGGERASLEQALGPGLWEFQPGVALSGSLLVVQARQWPREEREGRLVVVAPGEAKSFALALDRRDGRRVWSRFLSRGTDVQPGGRDRFGPERTVRTCAQPVVAVGARAFLGTNLGVAHLLDLADGRPVWSFLCRRRDARASGWRGPGAPPLAAAGGQPLVLWAPADSDHLYWLRAAPDLDGAGLLAHPPHPIGEGEELVGGDARRALVLGRAGARRTLSAHQPDSGLRYDSVYLGREETPLRGGLVGGRRALFATDHGLYLLDLERELYLLQDLSLGPLERRESGGLFARGELVHLLAGAFLWTVRAR